MIRTPYEAGGFAFSDEEMMEKAVKEGEGIRYIRNSADMKDPQMVFGIYNQMVQQRLFETPVGYAYLYELQEYLRANPSVDNRDIPPIPVVSHAMKAPQKPMQAESAKKKESRKTEARNLDYKPWFKASMTVSVILLLIVIGMFAVTATSGNINILNYENKLIEKYENWDAQLKEREQKIKERENALLQKEAPSEKTPL